MGGFFAEPLTQYPNAQWLRELGIFTQVMEMYPFLLPNVVVAIFCLLSAAAVTFFLEETLPESQRMEWRPGCIGQDLADSLTTYWSNITACCCPPLPLSTASATCEESTWLLTNGNNNNSHHQQDTPPLPPIWSRFITRKHLIAHWIFSFVVAALDEAFPLFCLSTVGGLALTEVSIGQLLSLAGVFFAVFHYCIYAGRFGKLRSSSLVVRSFVKSLPTM